MKSWTKKKKEMFGTYNNILSDEKKFKQNNAI